MHPFAKILACALLLLTAFLVLTPADGSGKSSTPAATPIGEPVPSADDPDLPPGDDCLDCAFTCGADSQVVGYALPSAPQALGAGLAAPKALGSRAGARWAADTPCLFGFHMTFPAGGKNDQGVGLTVEGSFVGGPLDGCTFKGKVDAWIVAGPNGRVYAIRPSVVDKTTGARGLTVTCKVGANVSEVQIDFKMEFPTKHPLPAATVDTKVQKVGSWSYIPGTGIGFLAGAKGKGAIEAGRSQNDAGGFFIEGIFELKQ